MSIKPKLICIKNIILKCQRINSGFQKARNENIYNDYYDDIRSNHCQRRRDIRTRYGEHLYLMNKVCAKSH